MFFGSVKLEAKLLCSAFVYLFIGSVKFEPKSLCNAKCNVPLNFKFEIFAVLDLTVNTSSEESGHLDLHNTIVSVFFLSEKHMFPVRTNSVSVINVPHPVQWFCIYIWENQWHLNHIPFR